MWVCVVLRHLVVSARVDINRVYIRGHLVDDDDGGVTVTVSTPCNDDPYMYLV